MYSHGQMKVKEGSVFVSANTTLYINGDLTIDATNTFDNAGTVNLSGDLINNGTLTSQSNSKFAFTGTGVQYVKSNNAIFEKIDLKAPNSFVILLDDFALNKNISFLDDQIWFVLGANDLTMSPTTQTFGHGTDNFFITNNQGRLIIESNYGRVHHVGYDQFNYLPVLAYSPPNGDDVAVRVYENAYEDGIEGGVLITEDVVNATWDIEKSTPGSSEFIVRPYWQAINESANFDRNNSGVGWFDGISYDGASLTNALSVASLFYHTDWSVNAQSGKYIVGGLPALNYVLCAPRVFLQGPFNGTDMNDNLRLASAIPLTEPHTDLGFLHTGTGGAESVNSLADFDNLGTDDDIVDWVFVELRQYLDNDEIYLTTSALLQRDGDIVNTDMEPLKMYGAYPGDYYLTIRHRNHLGIHSLNKLSLDKTTSYIDFTDGSTATLGLNAQLDLGAGVFGLWSGDANRDGQVNAVDKNNYWRIQNGTPYDYLNSTADFNLDAVINAVDKNAKWRISNSQISNYDY